MKKVYYTYEEGFTTMQKDYLFIITKDLWMHILDFSTEE